MSQIVLKYWRHHNIEWMECDTVDEAVGSAWSLSEYGDGVGDSVVTLTGDVLLDNDALQARIDAYDKARPKPVYHTPAPIPEADLPAATAFSKFMGSTAPSAYHWEGLDEEIKAVWRKKAAALEEGA